MKISCRKQPGAILVILAAVAVFFLGACSSPHNSAKGHFADCYGLMDRDSDDAIGTAHFAYSTCVHNSIMFQKLHLKQKVEEDLIVKECAPYEAMYRAALPKNRMPRAGDRAVDIILESIREGSMTVAGN